MQKIKSVFQRDYEGNRQVIDAVVEGSEWVLEGHGVPTVKWDGTSCMIRNNVLYKRFDRKLNKGAYKLKKQGHKGPWEDKHFKSAPEGWEPCEPEPNQHTGHWPGWMPVSNAPEDTWHREATAFHRGVYMGVAIGRACGEDEDEWGLFEIEGDQGLDIGPDGTYELVGPMINGNPYHLEHHSLVPHGQHLIEEMGRTFEDIRDFLTEHVIEGIVFHHEDGRMAKIKRRDFGLPWPQEN